MPEPSDGQVLVRIEVCGRGFRLGTVRLDDDHTSSSSNRRQPLGGRGQGGTGRLANGQPWHANSADAHQADDHDRPDHYSQLLMFPSELEATESARLPDTEAAFERWSELLDGEPVFHNLDGVAHLGGPTAAQVDWRAATTPGAG